MSHGQLLSHVAAIAEGTERFSADKLHDIITGRRSVAFDSHCRPAVDIVLSPINQTLAIHSKAFSQWMSFEEVKSGGQFTLTGKNSKSVVVKNLEALKSEKSSPKLPTGRRAAQEDECQPLIPTVSTGAPPTPPCQIADLQGSEKKSNTGQHSAIYNAPIASYIGLDDDPNTDVQQRSQKAPVDTLIIDPSRMNQIPVTTYSRRSELGLVIKDTTWSHQTFHQDSDEKSVKDEGMKNKDMDDFPLQMILKSWSMDEGMVLGSQEIKMQEKGISTFINDEVENVDAPNDFQISSLEPTSEQKYTVKKDVDGYSSKLVDTESDSVQQIVLSRNKTPSTSSISQDMAQSLVSAKENKGKEIHYKMLELRHKELNYSNEESIRASKLKQMEFEIKREALKLKREEMGLQRQENEFALIRSLVDKKCSAAEIEEFLRCTRCV